MGNRKPIPRLNQHEVRELRKVSEELAAADGLLQATNWAAAPAVRVLIGRAYVTIAAVYNKCEPGLPEFSQEITADRSNPMLENLSSDEADESADCAKPPAGEGD